MDVMSIASLGMAMLITSILCPPVLIILPRAPPLKNQDRKSVV